GKIENHQAPERREAWPTRISVPSEGWVGGSPTPRNDSVASVRTASARLIVAMTRTGPSTLGNRWPKTIRVGEMPMTRAAWMYSLLRSCHVDERTVRAYCTLT